MTDRGLERRLVDRAPFAVPCSVRDGFDEFCLATIEMIEKSKGSKCVVHEHGWWWALRGLGVAVG